MAHIPKPPTKPPFTRFQAQEYMNTHYPQTQDQLQKHIEKTLHFYKTNSPRLPPCDEILWEWFQGSFRLWSIHDFKNLGADSQKELRRYLRCGGVFVRPEADGVSIGQTLYKAANEDKQHVWTNDDVKDCKLDLQKGPITSIWITATRDLRLPLPFASFAQEAIPLNQQYKELPEERQKRLRQEQLRQQKRAHSPPRPAVNTKPRPSKPRYPPQPSKCRLCKSHFDSKNALFRHLEHCKTSQLAPRSRASSVASRSSASSASSRVSRASSASSTSSAATIASIEKVQLQILSQLHAVQKIKPLAHVRRCRNPILLIQPQPQGTQPPTLPQALAKEPQPPEPPQALAKQPQPPESPQALAEQPQPSIRVEEWVERD
jgi:hypothetical protein